MYQKGNNMRVFSLIRSPRAAVLWTIVLLLPLALMLASPLLMPYGLLMTYYVAPCALCMASVLGGLLPMLAGIVSCVAAMHIFFGLTGALLGCLYLLPVCAAFIAVFSVKPKFIKAVIAVGGAMFCSQIALFFLLQSMTGGQMYLAAGDAVGAYVASMPECDMLLITLYQSGLIGAASELSGDMLIETIGGYTLTEAARQDFLLSLSNIVGNLLSALVPSAIVSHSVYIGVAAVALTVRSGRVQWQREAFRSDQQDHASFPDLSMPPLAKWHLPRGWGMRVGVLAVGYLIMSFGRSQALLLAGTLMYAAFSSVYAIQGIAFVNFIQHKRDTKISWRIFAPILMFLFVHQALVILGVVDQISGARALRPPLNKNQRKDDDLQ